MQKTSDIQLRLEDLIPEQFVQAYQTTLSNADTLTAVQNNPGLIPIAVHTKSTSRIIWLDVEQHSFTERKFRDSIANIVQKQKTTYSFTSSLDILANSELVVNSLQPAGFIFHMSRCGSTLLARALAKNPRNFVLNEATPLHEGFWQHITDNWDPKFLITEQKINLIKNLILAIGRPRITNQDQYFIKFRSWNVAFINLLMQAFPETPCLFVYREPTEVMVSAKRNPPEPLLRLKNSSLTPFITQKPLVFTRKKDPLSYLSLFYQGYLTSALHAKTSKIKFLNYTEITKENLPIILKNGLSYTPPTAELALMKTQFDFYSKDNSNKVIFTSDKHKKKI